MAVTINVIRKDELYLKLAEFRVGRIFGFTITDVSSYVSRVLFYDKITAGTPVKNLFITTLTTPDSSANYYNYAISLAGIFDNEGYQSSSATSSYPPSIPFDLENKRFILYYVHGTPTDALFVPDVFTHSSEFPILDSTLIIAKACNNCAFYRLTSDTYDNLVCAEWIRNGAVGVYAAVDFDEGLEIDSSYSYAFDMLEGTILNRLYYDDIGTIMKEYQNEMQARIIMHRTVVEWESEENLIRGSFSVYLGDPTFAMPKKHAIVPPTEYTIRETETELKLNTKMYGILSEMTGDYYFAFFDEGVEIKTKLGVWDDREHFIIFKVPVRIPFDRYSIIKPDWIRDVGVIGTT